MGGGGGGGGGEHIKTIQFLPVDWNTVSSHYFGKFLFVFFITYFELNVNDLGSRRGVGDSAVYFTIAMIFYFAC